MKSDRRNIASRPTEGFSELRKYKVSEGRDDFFLDSKLHLFHFLTIVEE
jgi:hypothetical protein